MKNIGLMNISRLRRKCVRKMSENDVDYEFPLMVVALVLAVFVMLTLTV